MVVSSVVPEAAALLCDAGIFEEWNVMPLTLTAGCIQSS